MRRMSTDLPDRWFLLNIKDGNLRVGTFMSLMESTLEAAPASGPIILDAWLAADDGDASGLWAASLAGDLLFPDMFVWGQYAAAGSADDQVARERFASGEGGYRNLGDAATAFVWGGGALADAWPAAAEVDAYDHVRTSQVETLLISGELDMTTPPQVAAEELLPYLPNGRQVVLPALGHTVSFWNEQPEAGTHLITTYFDTGEVDDSAYGPQRVDFTPGMTFTAVAKIVAGSLVGLALITVLSLLWMAGHVRRRGGFGPKTGVGLRSVFAVVLGFGGWALGALLVLTVMPTVPLTGAVLAVVGVGVPVGLGAYLAWVQRGWSGSTKAAGLAASMGGAVIGGWLGFLAGSGMLAVFSVILGATLGANLLLIALDIAAPGSDAGSVPPVPAYPVIERVGA
jgi:hypothetical protein